MTRLRVQVPCGKQKNDTELRVLPRQFGRSGNRTFSRIRSTHLPRSSLPHRPQQNIPQKPFSVRPGEDFDCVSLGDMLIPQELYWQEGKSIHLSKAQSKIFLTAPTMTILSVWWIRKRWGQHKSDMQIKIQLRQKKGQKTSFYPRKT